MFDYVIVHGSYGSPFENWFPWLYSELTKRGKNVLVPQFPCGEGIQNYTNWEKVLDSYRDMLDSNTSFVGHSLAPAFIVDYILQNRIEVNRLVFAAPFYGLINIPEFDSVNSPFFFKKDLERVKDYSKKRLCFISSNDPYVPNELSLEFANAISAETQTVDSAGHFNTSVGYDKFEILLEKLL